MFPGLSVPSPNNHSRHSMLALLSQASAARARDTNVVYRKKKVSGVNELKKWKKMLTPTRSLSNRGEATLNTLSV